jgi:hypothetical protein
MRKSIEAKTLKVEEIFNDFSEMITVSKVKVDESLWSRNKIVSSMIYFTGHKVLLRPDSIWRAPLAKVFWESY